MRPSLTGPRRDETIRKLGAAAALVLLAGCATSGPNHVYFTLASGAAVQDRGPTSAEIGGVLRPGEQALGLAYDFNTDHLFVRVAPAQVIRVIERPSARILREMPLPENLRASGPADLAIRSSDRHLFAVHAEGRSVVELTLFGDFVRRLELPGLGAPIGGLAYDQHSRRLLVLTAATPARVAAVDDAGNLAEWINLSANVAPQSLGYDSAARRLFVPLKDGHLIGEFDAAGKLVATHPAGGAVTAIDAGARSLVRVF